MTDRAELMKLQAAKRELDALINRQKTVDISHGKRGARLNVTLGGSWTVNQIRRAAVGLVEEIVQGQVKLDNPPDGIYVDGRLGGQFAKMRRGMVIPFPGGTDARSTMRSLERAVSGIPGTTWQWQVRAADPRRQQILTTAVRTGKAVPLQAGDRLYLFPTSFTGTPDPTHRNSLTVGNRTRTRIKQGIKSRRRAKGYYAVAAGKARRTGKSKGLYVRAIHSFKYYPQGRVFPPGVKAGDPTKAGGRYQGSWGFVIRRQTGRR